MRYRGRADQEVNGRPWPTLWFSADVVTIRDLAQLADLPGDRDLKTTGNGTSTFKGRPVQMYIYELTGTLTVAGLPTVPITLSARFMPAPSSVGAEALRLSQLTFSDVRAQVVLLEAEEVHVPSALMSLD